MMMKACTIMTFLMTIIARYAPETLCRAVDIFRNGPVTHYTHNSAVNKGQITPVAVGTTNRPNDVILSCRITFCRMDNCLLVETVKAGLRAS